MNAELSPLHQKPAVVAVAASLVAAIALWLSRASFDVAGTTEAPVRVAMLPSLAELAGLVVLALLLTAAIAWVLGWVRGLPDVLMPVFALGLLALPYLPWLPDWLPVLRVLAGPGSWLVWVIVVGQVTWLIAHRRAITTGRVSSVACIIVIFLVSCATYAYATSHLTQAQRVRWTPAIAAAVIGALTWWWAAVLFRSKPAATFGWASVFLSVPFVLNSREFIPGAFRDAMAALRQLSEAKQNTLASSGPGLLFDQEFGIFPLAPVLLLALVGLAGLMRDPVRRKLGVMLSSGALLLIAFGGIVDPWWNESIMPGRRVLLLLPMLVAPLAWLYVQTASRPLLRSGLHILLLTSVGMTLVVVAAAREIPFPQEGDGSSSLLQWMSQTWYLWQVAPSYVGTNLPAAFARTALWLVAFVVAGWVLSRKSSMSDGRAALRATIVVVVMSIAVVSVGSALPIGGSSSRFSAEGRVLFPMLEAFDPVARPTTVRYDPLSIVAAEDVFPLFALSAVPGQRLDRQPLRVVLNARFRLPAGDYEVEMTGSELAGTVPEPTVGLQIGREGAPLEVWPLTVGPGAHQQHHFRVPLDAEFVGFRATRQVERTIASLRVRPVRIVPSRQRFHTPTVRAAASFGPATMFFHDANAYPEPEGIWTKGGSAARMTLMKADEHLQLIALAMHSGARPNVVTVSTGDWSERFELAPGVTATVSVPSKAGQPFIPITITSASGFVPADIDGGGDRRVLGAWIAFKPGDTSRTSAAP